MLTRSVLKFTTLALIATLAAACGGSPAAQPPEQPQAAPTSAATEAPAVTALPPLTPPSEPPSSQNNLDQTWAIPLGAAYELIGICQDAPMLANMTLDEQLGEEMTTLGLVMLGDQLTVVNSGLAGWQPTEAQVPYVDPLNQYATDFTATVSDWLNQEMDATEAQNYFNEQCPGVSTLLDDLNQLARDEGVSEDYLANMSDTYQGMPSIFDFLGPE